MKEKFSSEDRWIVDLIDDWDDNKALQLQLLFARYEDGKLVDELQDWLTDDVNKMKLIRAVANDYEIVEEKYAIRLTDKPNNNGHNPYLDHNWTDISWGEELTNNVDTFTMDEIRQFKEKNGIDYEPFARKVEE